MKPSVTITALSNNDSETLNRIHSPSQMPISMGTQMANEPIN